MTENSGSGTWVAGIGLGILIGGFFAFLIMRQKAQATSQALLPAIPCAPCPTCPPYPTVPADAPPENRQAEIISVVPVQSCTYPVPSTLPPSFSPPPQIPTIVNEEVWDIKKDQRGRVEKIIVHRQVKPAGQVSTADGNTA